MPFWLPSGTTWIQSNISFLDKFDLKVSLIFISAQSIVPTPISGMIFQNGVPSPNSDFSKAPSGEIRSSLVGKSVISRMGLNTTAWRT